MTKTLGLEDVYAQLEAIGGRRRLTPATVAVGLLRMGLRCETARLRASHRVAAVIAPGPTPSTRTVSFTAAGASFRLEVDAEHVNDVEGTLRVYVLDDRDDHLLVQFPHEPIEGPVSVLLPRSTIVGVGAPPPHRGEAG